MLGLKYELQKGMESIMKLVLIRHGESEFNALNKKEPHTRVFSGQADILLTTKGKEQAKSLQKYPEIQQSTLVFSSDLTRAFETAQLATNRMDIQRDKRINERSLGYFNGKSEAELTEYRSFLQTQEFKHSFTIAAPEGENYEHVSQRVTAFLLELPLKSEQTISVFSHFVATRLMLRALLGLSKEQTTQIKIKNCEPIILEGTKLGEFRLLTRLGTT